MRFGRTKNPSDLEVPRHAAEDLTPEDTFSDFARENSESTEGKLEVPLSPFSTRAFFAVAYLLIASLGLYTLYLAFSEGSHLAALSEQNARRVEEIGPSRGDITASDGTVIATSVSAFDIELNPSRISEDEGTEIAGELSAAFEKLDFESLNSKIQTARKRNLGSVLVVKNLDDTEVRLVKELLERHSALILKEHELRVYPQGNLFSHIVGYAASVTPQDVEKHSGYDLNDIIGKKGLERFFEDSLKGTPGLFAKFVTSRGEVIKEKIIRPVGKGATIKTTIDADLQASVHRELNRTLNELNLKRGAVVVLEPDTGAVLALVSSPDFDPGNFAQGLTETEASQYFNSPDKPLFNRITAGEYSTGSVIKPVIAAAALEENIISPVKYLFTHGFITVPSVFDPSVVYRFNDWKNHGAVDMREAIAVSSNVYFYTIGGGYQDQEGLGIEKISKWLSRFGWGKKLGINFSAESEGRVPTPEWKRNTKDERWSIGDTYNVSIGQGDILATPLQVSAATAVFANNGTLYKPFVVEEIYPQEGDPEVFNKGDIIQANFLSQRALTVTKEGMRRAVTDGSSSFLQQLPVAAAGKTGTAQTSGPEDNAWFTGFAPYENPEVVITVLLEEGETSNNAVHTAHRILNHYFSRPVRE